MRRTKEILLVELETCKENAKHFFNIELDQEKLGHQIAEIIAEKVNSYFYQRFRDWHVHDLLAMQELLFKKEEAVIQDTEDAPKRRGRPPKTEAASL